MAYINNVLYYIDHNIKGSSENKVIEVCKLLFQEKEIIEAKQYLLVTCQPVLAWINKSLSEDVKKERRNSDDRSRVDVNIKDIINDEINDNINYDINEDIKEDNYDRKLG